MSLLTQSHSLRGSLCNQYNAFKPAATKAQTSRCALLVEANKRVQKKAKVILTQDVLNIGSEGQVKTVKVGYFRNWLYPQGLAKPATTTILDAIRTEKEREIKKKVEEKAQAQAFAEVLSGMSKFAIKKKSGDNDRIFGSVSTQEITEAILAATGRKLSKDVIDLPEIKTLGAYDVAVKLHPEVTGTFQLLVVKEKDIKITVQQGRKK